jgi:hypothetical protein
MGRNPKILLIVSILLVIAVSVGTPIYYMAGERQVIRQAMAGVPTDYDLIKDRLGAARATYLMIHPELRTEFMRQIYLCVDDEPVFYEGTALALLNRVSSLVNFNEFDLVITESLIPAIVVRGHTDLPKNYPIFAKGWLKIYNKENQAIWADLVHITHNEFEPNLAEMIYVFPPEFTSELFYSDLEGMYFTIDVDFYPQKSDRTSMTVEAVLHGLDTGQPKYLVIRIIDAEHFGTPVSDKYFGFLGFEGEGSTYFMEMITAVNEISHHEGPFLSYNYPSFVTVGFVQLYADSTFYYPGTEVFIGSLLESQGNGVNLDETFADSGIRFVREIWDRDDQGVLHDSHECGPACTDEHHLNPTPTPHVHGPDCNH